MSAHSHSPSATPKPPPERLAANLRDADAGWALSDGDVAALDAALAQEREVYDHARALYDAHARRLGARTQARAA